MRSFQASRTPLWTKLWRSPQLMRPGGVDRSPFFDFVIGCFHHFNSHAVSVVAKSEICLCPNGLRRNSPPPVSSLPHYSLNVPKIHCLPHGLRGREVVVFLVLEPEPFQLVPLGEEVVMSDSCGKGRCVMERYEGHLFSWCLRRGSYVMYLK